VVLGLRHGLGMVMGAGLFVMWIGLLDGLEAGGCDGKRI